MSVTSKRTDMNERCLAACVGKRLVECSGDPRAEEMVIFGIDPQHGYMRGFAEVVEGSHQFDGITDLVGLS